MSRSLFLMLFMSAGLSSCSPGGGTGALSMAREVNIRAALKAVSAAQFLRWSEREEYAGSLSQLQRDGYGSAQLNQVVAAHQAGQSWHGYIFRDLVRDEAGGPIDRRLRYGLSAVPEKSGSGTSFLLLIDASKLRIDEGRGALTDAGIEYYKSASPQTPQEVFPGPATLAKWEKIQQLSPQEGLEKARGAALR